MKRKRRQRKPLRIKTTDPNLLALMLKFPQRVCGKCEKLFIPMHDNHKFCSAKCWKEATGFQPIEVKEPNLMEELDEAIEEAFERLKNQL